MALWIMKSHPNTFGIEFVFWCTTIKVHYSYITLVHRGRKTYSLLLYS